MAYEIVGSDRHHAEAHYRIRMPHRIRFAFERVHPRVAAYSIAIFVSSTLDAFFTLTMIDAGFAQEVNPFMRALLEIDARLFVNVKLAVTGSALVFLAACADRVLFGRLKIVQILAALAFFYAALVCYEVWMLVVGFIG